MSSKYSINLTSKILTFTGKPSSLNDYTVRASDKADIASVVIPNSVKFISAWAFYEYSSLGSIHISNSVSTINEQAFRNCSFLASVHIPNSVSTIATNAFYTCSALTSVHIPKSITKINSLTFQYCYSLTSIHIPNSVATIGGWAFDNCHRLHKTCLPTNSTINIYGRYPAFPPQTAILRPYLKPIIDLQKKFACRASKTSYSIYL